jgi:signal transduction histidine kinase
VLRFFGIHTLGHRLREVAAPPDQAREERVLAGARVFLAVASLAAIYMDPTEPRRWATVAYALMVAYALHSLFVWAYIRVRPAFSPGFPLFLHGIDLLWPATITIFSEGPNSPFFFFFFFVLLSAAFRWGFRQTLYTAGIAVVVVWVQAAFIYGWFPLQLPVAADLDLNRLIMRSSYVAIMGFLLAYLGEEEKQLRAEQAVIASLIAQLRVEGGIREALRLVADTLLRLFSGGRLLVVATDVATQQSFLWEFVHGAPRARQEAIELEQRELRNYLTEVPGPVWFRYPDGSSVALASDGRGLHTGHVPPANFQSAHPHRTVLGATFEMGRQWAARMYLLDPQVRIGSTELQFTSSILQHVAPALYNVYLLRRLRRQGGAVERARVARELHDGAIQTLISAEMQVDVLRRTASGSNGSIGDQLGNIQELLRREVLNLRELMQQMRPVEVSPKQLLDYLADLADRFQRDTGIHAQFVSNLEDAANLPPRLCREVARIVQEALVNVRRHSGASNVLIRFSSGPGAWKLVIDDDGRGFSFSGHFSHDELDAAHKGPLVIKERVRSIGGDLAVESQPGTGARLEISIPHRVDAHHA